MSEQPTTAARKLRVWVRLDEALAEAREEGHRAGYLSRTEDERIEAEAAPTPQTHPEHFCERCGGPNLMWWHAPSPLWNTVMRDSEGLEKFGVVCPRCFGELAREQGVADFFCLTTHDPLVPLPSVFGDGRVWDAAKCMWVEAKEQDR